MLKNETMQNSSGENDSSRSSQMYSKLDFVSRE